MNSRPRHPKPRGQANRRSASANQTARPEARQAQAETRVKPLCGGGDDGEVRHEGCSDGNDGIGGGPGGAHSGPVRQPGGAGAPPQPPQAGRRRLPTRPLRRLRPFPRPAPARDPLTRLPLPPVSPRPPPVAAEP
jgi:hypothetical protein